ncbi:alpha/beta knot [Stemphylium lycopersici]|uniref:rRNA methyltransferase 1, mitochondrial n=1 Tax=Stemphylium lycopersici TaxID=183478 RepID=A0A364MV50_STELY|nr:hypothetical protein TW65_08471 [Stemphylium lycopersici]RAR04448.1 alpha/beta knot [Stemphylium lycopersici]RAR05682.1 alpha/beta knot [Stemphylium lycopersici]
MVYPCLNGSSLLRTQRIALPHTFCRYKSITSAIERGRQGGPERPFKPRPRTRHNDEGDGQLKTRREARFERFGPPRDDPPPAAEEWTQQSGRLRRFQSGSRREMSAPKLSSAKYYEEKSPWAKSGVGRLTKEGDLFRPRETRDGQLKQHSHAQGDTGSARNDSRSERFDRFSRKSGFPPAHSPRNRDTSDGRFSEPRFSHRPDSKGARRERFGRENAGAPPTDGSDSTVQRNVAKGPESLPYTTAASEFIYGHSSVLAAIKANRRKFYNIYVHSRGANRDGLMSRIRANKLFSITQEVGDEYMRALDKASSGRPHNGVILESSPLPVPPITELKTASIQDESFSLALDSQSAEDVLVNGRQELYTYKSAGWRHPLILYVDGVVDEGNLGAIARSAYVLGADAIVTPTHHTANWSHIALKASAGAAEAIPLFKVGEPTEFLGKSSRAGWRIYASDAVPPAPAIGGSIAETTDTGSGKVVYTIARSTKRLPSGHSPVAEHPTILMMGAESTGLKTSLLNLAHYKVGIPHGREVNEVGVDSLNVSVAASILCYEMLQRPKAQPKRDPEEVLF